MNRLLIPETIQDIVASNDTLVVHLRSGDIFDAERNDFYWQPPLGYYQFVAWSFRRVVIVSQTKNNPVVDLFFDFCLQQKGQHNCFLQTDTNDVIGDLALLMHARHLCLGFGSFGFVVATLSRHVETLYYPFTMLEKEVAEWVDTDRMMRDKGRQSFVVYFDERMSYAHQKWIKSKQQVEMLATKIDNLIGLKLKQNK